VTANHFAVIFDRRPPVTLGTLVSNEIRHAYPIVWIITLTECDPLAMP
jgi:hypothetical protein